MQNFRLMFDLAMTAWPLAFVLLFPAKPALRDARLANYRRGLSWLSAATAGAWLLILALHAYHPDVYGLWALCFALWFAGAMRVMRHKRADWAGPHVTPTTTRQASLRSRVHASPVPKPWWAMAWCTWLISLSATVAVLDGLHFAAVLPLCFSLMGAFWLIMGQLGMRWFLLEPEPLDSRGSTELRDAYARLRKLKVYGWFWLCVAAMLLFNGIALMLGIGVGVTPLVIVGAAGGSLVGVFGGCFGTYATVLRGRIADLREQLDRAAATDEVST